MNRIIVADWSPIMYEARAIRDVVFIQEQGVPRELEWDEFDAVSWHAIAYNAEQRACGTGRLLPAQQGVGSIGRMAVLAEYRGQGVGAALLLALLERAQQRHDVGVRLHAQTHALGFYEKFGFVKEGEGYLEAGIPHYSMFKLCT
jgi:predicted GNAT family N-acyltransferase